MRFTEKEIEGNITSIDTQLLLDIRNLLQEIVGVLKPIELENNAQTSDKIICKQCGRGFDNIGLMLSHCKKEHKKEGKNG